MPARCFTDEQERQILAEYAAGATCNELARKYGVSKHPILAAIRRTGSKPRKHWETNRELFKRDGYTSHNKILTPQQDLEVASMYTAGITSSVIAATLGVSLDVVFYSLNRQKVEMRKHSRLCTLYEEAFDDAENDVSGVKAYFAGLFFADGCVSIPKFGQKFVNISLSGVDRTHIEDYRVFLRTNRKITVGAPRKVKSPFDDHLMDGKEKWSLTVQSDKIAATLQRYGIVPNKSHAWSGAQVRILEDNRHFWAGVVCGDGWVTPDDKEPIIGLCGLKVVCEQFLAFAKQHTNTSTSVVKQGTIWRVNFTCRAARILAELLFPPDRIALPRKKAFALKIVENYSLIDHQPHLSYKNLTRNDLVRLYEQHGTWDAVARSLGAKWGASLNCVRKRCGLL